jgi:virginiamycin B lyase
MKQPYRRLLALVLCSVLAACASGATGASLPSAHVATIEASTAKRLKATIRIAIPRKHHHRVRIHGHYVSPSTQSIVIAITLAGGSTTLNFNADLTPATNPNCVASLISPLICTIGVDLTPGNYTASFATYDGLLAGGNGPHNPPTGNELSANQDVPLTVASGQSNAIDVTLEGLPAGAVLVPDASATLSGNAAAGYSLAKCSSPPQKVQVVGVDADGNYILGPGAPVPSLASNDAADLPITATPGPLSANRFVLTPPSFPRGNAVVKLTATVTPTAGSGGASRTTSVNVTVAGTICGVVSEFPVPTANSGPAGITLGPDGALWFTESCGDNVGRITTGGAITETAVPSAAGEPYGITTGPGGTLWFAEDAGDRLGWLAAGGGISEQVIPTANGGPSTITLGPDGALWFTEGSGNKIGRDAGGALSETTIPTAGSQPVGITAGPDGALWFTELNGDKIGRITTGGSITEFAIPTVGSKPVDITTGPDGALWFTEGIGNKIGRITTGGAISEFPVPTAGSQPFGIRTGPDGALWFAEFTGNNIGRITTGGSITETALPTPSRYPTYLVTGPDGALWFTEQAGNNIGRLQ